ncbi:MAG: 4-hydroxythreonine-4-phosphate dehydrogenase PdxA, partial [Rhodospirillales bacterium]
MTVPDPVLADDGRPLAVTMGEPAGIGGEIALKAWHGRVGEGLSAFFVIDDPSRLEALAGRLGLEARVEAIGSPAEAKAVFASALPVLPVTLPAVVDFGRPDPANAGAVREAIETAVRLAAAGDAAAVVTNPIHKQTMFRADFPYPGHTEFLAALAGAEAPPVMMLAAEELRVVPVSVHQSLEATVRTLDTGTIVHAGRVTAAALVRDFGVAGPRLAVAGLNPHAGEDGAFGSEETTIIGPAVEALKEAGIDATGPVPPDALFTPRARETYDAAICMYHDQALIPIKALAFDRAVNVTLGLPFVRTSPDHGTALDIAGTGRASESSLMAALRMAGAMARHRATARAA